MAKTAPAQNVALGLLGAARGRSLPVQALVKGGEILGVSGNAMRLTLSRLAARGDLRTEGRGRYVLSDLRRNAVAHVRTYLGGEPGPQSGRRAPQAKPGSDEGGTTRRTTGFAARVPWQGRFLGVLTGDLSRRQPTDVARRERALLLSGFRAFRHGLWVRPDNLAGGRVVVEGHLRRLGLDRDAEVITVELDGGQLREVEHAYDVAADEREARRLSTRVHQFLAKKPQATAKVAAESYWLGDEVLRFLASDPLLPESMADPEPRRALAAAMSVLDERGFALWSSMLEELAP